MLDGVRHRLKKKSPRSDLEIIEENVWSLAADLDEEQSACASAIAAAKAAVDTELHKE